MVNTRFRRTVYWAVFRDIVYGLSRGYVQRQINILDSPFWQASGLSLAVVLACVIPTPLNQLQGYALLPRNWQVSFNAYLKHQHYFREALFTSVVAGLAIFIGALIESQYLQLR